MKKLRDKLSAWANGNVLALILVFLLVVVSIGSLGAFVTTLLYKFAGIHYVYGTVITALVIMGSWIALVKLTE